MIGLFPLKQSTASQEVLLGPFISDTDGKTAQTGLTVANTDIKLWKSGGTTESNKASGGATHISAGRYYAVLDATDTDTLGPLEINVHVATALPIKLRCIVLTANAYDSLVSGTDNLFVDTRELSGTPQTARDIGANVLLSAGSGAGQINLTSGNVTVGAYPGNTPQTGDAYLAAQNIQSRIPTVLVSGRMDASVGAMAPDTLTAAALAADAVTEIQAGLATSAALTTVSSGVTAIQAKTDNLPVNPAAVGSPMNLAIDSVNAAALAATAIVEIQNGLATASVVNAIKPVTDKLDTAVELDGAVYRFTTNALEQAPSGPGGGGATAEEVWTLADGIEPGCTPQEAIRLILADAAGDVTGGDTSTNVFRNLAKNKNRITSTVDEAGNRVNVYDKS